jgi:hypothetical protein
LPSANARIGDENQEAPSAPRYDIDDPKGFEKFVNAFSAMLTLLESPNSGDRAVAASKTVFFLKSHGLRWIDIIRGWNEHRRGADAQNAADQRDIAVEAAAVLQERVNELEGRLAAYERGGGGPAVEAWQDVGALDPQEWARRVLAEQAAKRIYLNRFESEFLPSVAAWGGPLTAPQQLVFDKIKASVTRRSGKPAP